MSVCQPVIDFFGVNLATLGVVFPLRVIKYNVNNVSVAKSFQYSLQKVAFAMLQCLVGITNLTNNRQPSHLRTMWQKPWGHH